MTTTAEIDRLVDASIEEAVKDALTPLPLDWVKLAWRAYAAKTPFGLVYQICDSEGVRWKDTGDTWVWRTVFDGPLQPPGPPYEGGNLTFEQVKAVCQADFNNRALACFVSR